jgi:ribosome assembly protein 1
MSQWLPLARATLLTVIDKLPSPIEAQPVKVPPILLPKPRSSYTQPTLALEPALVRCDPSGETIAFVAKMISVPKQLISGYRAGDGDVDANNSAELLVGVARVFSGTLHAGAKVHVLGPRYDPADPDNHRTTVTISQLFMLMGRELTAVVDAPAGNIVAIAGLAGAILKWGTISSTTDCPSLGVNRIQSGTPILRVAVESAEPSEMPQLIAGLQLLNQADPCAEVIVQETGEHVLLTAGELHLERCLRDLRETFAKVELHVSPPIVPFRETLSPIRRRVDDEQESAEAASANLTTATVSNQACTIRVSCSVLPAAFTKQLAAVGAEVDQLLDGGSGDADAIEAILDRLLVAAAAEENSPDLQSKLKHLWSLGPKRSGPNLLINGIETYERQR